MIAAAADLWHYAGAFSLAHKLPLFLFLFLFCCCFRNCNSSQKKQQQQQQLRLAIVSRAQLLSSCSWHTLG